MIAITDPYRSSYEPPDHLRDFEEERRVTRECLLISAEIPGRLLVRDDVLVIPEGISQGLRDRMLRHEGYLRWSAGLPATHWLPGGPANFPDDGGPTS